MSEEDFDAARKDEERYQLLLKSVGEGELEKRVAELRKVFVAGFQPIEIDAEDLCTPRISWGMPKPPPLNMAAAFKKMQTTLKQWHEENKEVTLKDLQQEVQVAAESLARVAKELKKLSARQNKKWYHKLMFWRN